MGEITSKDLSALCQRVETLESQVRHLAAEVVRLSVKPSPLVQAALPPEAASDSTDTDDLATVDFQQFKASNLLPTVAAVSFLLAIALVLRTLVDSGTVARHMGAYVGLVYAVLLLVLGHIRYTKAHRAIPVYSVCGTLLLFSIVLEGHIRFHIFPTVFSYIVLGLAMTVTLALGVRHAVPSLAVVGLLGTVAAGIALEFPEPAFPVLGALILLANIGVRYAIRLRHVRWLNWAVLALTIFFWILWAVRATHAASSSTADLAPAWLAWFMPTLAVCAGWYLLVAASVGMRKARSRGNFETALPPMTVAFAYPVSLAYAGAVESSHLAITLWVFPAAIVMVLFAFFLARVMERPQGTPVSFILAALLLLCVSLRATLETDALILPVCSLLGLLSMVLSLRWKSHGLRIASSLVQFYVLALALIHGFALAPGTFSMENAGLAVALGVMALIQYMLARRASPETKHSSGSPPLNWLASAVLLVALIFFFCAARLSWHHLCSGSGNLMFFQAGQSLMLQVGGLLVALFALRRRAADLAVIAIMVMILGTAKVICYDLIHVQGVALVLSISSVGVAASLGALIWKKWQSESS